jgi:hypothetical protein
MANNIRIHYLPGKGSPICSINQCLFLITINFSHAPFLIPEFELGGLFLATKRS